MSKIKDRLKAEVEKAKSNTPEGITVYELCELLGTGRNVVQKALEKVGSKAIGNFGRGHTKLYSEEDAKKAVHEIMSHWRRE